VKKIFCLLAAVLLFGSVALLTGCPAKTASKPGPDDTITDPYPNTVNYTTVKRATADPRYPAGWTNTVNPYTDALKDQLNITYSINWEDSDYNTHLLADLTANTLPDVFNVFDYSTFMQMYNADAIKDLTSDYAQYCPSWFKNFYNTYPDIFSTVTKDGKLMGLPSTNNGYQQGLLWVRQDWLDALNLQPPKTIDDIETVARAFINNNMSGKDTTNGLIVNREDCFDINQQFGLQGLAATMGAYPEQWMKDANGQVYYGSIQPAFKQVLAKVASWVATGIISSDYFDDSFDVIAADATLGNAGLWFSPWTWPTESFLKHSPSTAQVVPYVAPLNADGKAVYATAEPYDKILCVRKDFVNSELIFKVYNLWYNMTMGLDQAGYDALAPMRAANTMWHTVAPLGEFAIRDNRTVPQVGAQVKDFVDNGTMPPAGSEAPRFMYNAQTWKQYLDSGSQGTPPTAAWPDYMQRYVASNITDTSDWSPVNPAFFWQTKTMADQWANLQSMEKTMMRTIMMDPTAIDTFDQFVIDWKAAGGDAITAEVQAAVSGS